MKIPTLETERLILRPVSMEDAPALQKYFNNWNIIKNLSLSAPWPYPDDGAESFLRDVAFPAIERGEALKWVILSKEEGATEAIGVIDYRIKPDKEGGNRGFWLAEPFWGRGYMTEAVTAMQDYVFFELGIEKIEVKNLVCNRGSSKIKEKTGAVFIGTEEQESHVDCKEFEVWEVTRESWAKLRGRSLSSP